LTSLSYGPVVSAARAAILAMMNQSIKYGKLRILTDQGVYTFPPDAKDDIEAAEIRVIRDTFWLRLVTLGDLGFAEAYMSGDCEVSDLVKVFQVSHDDICYGQHRGADCILDLHPVTSRTRLDQHHRCTNYSVPYLLPRHWPYQLPIRQHHFQLAFQHQSPLRPFKWHV
jgi:hypothetical protein